MKFCNKVKYNLPFNRKHQRLFATIAKLQLVLNWAAWSEKVSQENVFFLVSFSLKKKQGCLNATSIHFTFSHQLLFYHFDHKSSLWAFLGQFVLLVFFQIKWPASSYRNNLCMHINRSDLFRNWTLCHEIILIVGSWNQIWIEDFDQFNLDYLACVWTSWRNGGKLCAI